jgi:hypothetical protein
MPETPEVLDEIAIELPARPSLPMREGEEERFGALLGMEFGARKESVLKQLRALLDSEGKPTSAEAVRTTYAASPSARRRQIACRKKVEELQKLTFRRGSDRWEGPCAPFTVINLNPVELRLIIGGDSTRWLIPACGKGEKINIKFKGRTFTGSYMTLKTPYVFPSHTGSHSDKATGVEMPAVDYGYIPPAGLAHQFYEHFVVGASDAQGMGGVLVFEGDIHTLDEPRMTRSKGCIWMPKKEITLEGFGDVVYTVDEIPLKDILGRMLTIQRDYASAKIREGHGFANHSSDIQRNQLNGDHIAWHNYALAHQYIEKALSWAVEGIKDRPTTEAIYCPDCRTRQADPQQYFCTNCNSPFDALKAFLAGKTVSPDRLAMYEGEEWDAIIEETARRKAKIALLNPEEDSKKAKKQ